MSEANDRPGWFDEFGGRFVAETLMPALLELERAHREIVPSAAFQRRWRGLLASYVGRPTPIYLAERLEKGGQPVRLWHRDVEKE